MLYFFVGFYLLVVGIQLFACANKNLLMLRRVSKCLLMPLLAACYMLISPEPAPFVVFAILSGFVGDLVLLFRPRKWAFPAGILAFATGHVFYILSFASRITLQPPWYLFALIAFVTIACAATLMYYIWRGIPRKLRVPSYVYMLVIGSMVSSAALFTLYETTPLRWLAALGGVLFALSDTTLSIDAFHHPVRYRNVIVMSTYILAQTLIVSAFAFS